VIRNGKRKLLQLALALHAATRFSCSLDRRKDNPNQQCDHEDGHQGLDQRETMSVLNHGDTEARRGAIVM
jgi:hypothetical protein